MTLGMISAMELGAQPKLNSFIFHSLPPLNRFCKQGANLSFVPYSLPPCAYKRICIGGSLHKQALLQKSNIFAGDCISSRKYRGIIDHSSNLRKELDRTYYRSFFHKQIRSFRSVVVRSELAVVGAAGDAVPVSEVPLSSRVRGIGFYAVTALAAIILFVLMVVAHPFVLLLDRHRRKVQHFVAKIWATITISPFFRVEFEGLENLPAPDTPAVYISNHQSFLDIYTLLTLGITFKFISKTSIFLYPVIGWAMFLLGTIPLKRMDSRSQLECLKRCMDLVNKGASVFFFPEGTRSKDGKLGVFKKGAFSIASKTGAPVVPITLIGTGKIMPPGLEGIVNSGSVKVIIHKPIEGDNPEILCDEARRRIADALVMQS